jgi:hypothetical protein
MTASAASASLSIRHIFGIDTNVTDNISFTDDETIVYVAGKLSFLSHSSQLFFFF